MSNSLVALLTALGDDELILGHRHSEWTGHAPHLEEDVAFSSIAQDEIGHAAAYYSLLAKITNDDPDRIALGREPHEYRHAVVCERPNGGWAYTLVRHWLYDTADDIRLETLSDSSNSELASIAVKLRREERYHLLHARAWMTRIARGPVEGRTKIIDSIGECFADATALFEPIDLEEESLREGWMPTSSAELRDRFMVTAVDGLEELGLPVDAATGDESAEFVASSSGDLIEHAGNASRHAPNEAGLGGRRGRHSSEFDSLWHQMTTTYRSEPGATW
jgi:ring-1,2-phenylacetyl-CoA epoxidase subunit PaaC